MAWIIENELGDCWSNAYGWVDGQDGDYDSFTDEERESLSLPLGGHWVQVPWKVE